MHLTAWTTGLTPVVDFDLDTEDGQTRLVDYLNEHATRPDGGFARVASWELSHLGERVASEQDRQAAELRSWWRAQFDLQDTFRAIAGEDDQAS